MLFVAEMQRDAQDSCDLHRSGTGGQELYPLQHWWQSGVRGLHRSSGVGGMCLVFLTQSFELIITRVKGW